MKLVDLLRKSSKKTPVVSKKKEALLLVLGENHYNVWELEKSVIRRDIPKNITCLNFPRSYVELKLSGIQKEDVEGEYEFVGDAEEGRSLDIHNLNFFEVMRPRYAITEDGRLFQRGDSAIVSQKDYEKIMHFLENYEEAGEEELSGE